tara:strand:+ start:48 stop:584 length:537 start_codon:yes stop_codon:yes gene_type:complete
MNLLFIYSGKCKHSQKLINYSIFDKINKLNIDYKKNLQHVPNYIDSVPVLIIKNNNNLNILKNKNLLEWFINNSKKKKPNNNDNNNINNQSNGNNDVLEANILDSNFSSNYTFLEGNNDNILENNYSNLNSSNSNLAGQLDNNINIDTQTQKKEDNSLSKAYEDLIKSRDEYKTLDRV